MIYVKLEKISLENHPELNEKWVQDRISEDPKILKIKNEFSLMPEDCVN